jgi:hypothetical protein
MRSLLLIAGAAAVVAFILLAAPIEPVPVPHRSARAAPVLRVPTFAMAAATPMAAPALLQPETKKLTGEALAHRLDDQIPMEIYGEAAHCYHGGLPADRTLDLTYRIHVKDGELTMSEAGITAGHFGDGALERCIVDRILSYRAHDTALPDLDEDGDVFLRIGGFKPFLAQVAEDGDQPL